MINWVTLPLMRGLHDSADLKFSMLSSRSPGTSTCILTVVSLGGLLCINGPSCFLPNFDNPQDCVVHNLTTMGACIEFDANRIGRAWKTMRERPSVWTEA